MSAIMCGTSAEVGADVEPAFVVSRQIGRRRLFGRNGDAMGIVERRML